MKTRFLLLFFVAFHSVLLASQAPIMLCNTLGTTCLPYTNLADAYANANNGDIIYLPAGSFTMPNPLSKSISIIGVGANIDSSAAYGGVTQITNDIVLATNHITLEGLYIVSNVIAGDNGNLNISGTLIKQCRLVYLSYNTTYPYTKLNNTTVVNSYAEVLDFGLISTGSGTTESGIHGQNNAVYNCIVGGIANTENSTIKNCIFRPIGWSGGVSIVYSSQITNCIFWGPVVHNNYVENNIISHCSYTNPNVSSSNQLFSNLFVGSNIGTHPISWTSIPFPIKDNANIVASHPALTASDTGGEIGINGGMFPWNQSHSVPSNPHIFYKNIPEQTNSNALPVNIKVRTNN